jgi:hypothetical protein
VSAEVRIDPGAVARSLRLRNGLVARRLSARTERTARLVEQEAPGTMGDFVSWKVEDSPRGLQGVIVCDHPKVRLVLDGTRPHIIRPRRAKALHFFVEGREVFTTLVRHPGTRPNNFLLRALRRGA